METEIQPSLSHLEDHLGYQLRRVSNQVSGTFAQDLQALGHSVAEWVALRLIAEHGRMTSGQVADQADMTRGAMSKVMDKLVAKHLVSRTPHEQDARIQWLALTPAGVALLPDLAALADRNDTRFFSCLSAREQANLRSLLLKLAHTHQLRRSPVA